MLKQASIKQVKEQTLPRENSLIVITMRFYPRFLKKQLRDEFLCALAPDKQLLKEFNVAQVKLNDHNSSFAHVDYERRFVVDSNTLQHLKRLADLSKDKDVYLVCICDLGDRCHREMLLLLAQKLYDCHIAKVFHKYPEFMEREFATNSKQPCP